MVCIIVRGGQMQTAKVFMTGRSQAVRIPSEFRFSSKEVFIRRDEKSGDVILSARPSWKDILARIDAADIPEDFLSPEERNQQPPREPRGF
jgi:antitoxin VapB